MNLFLQVYCHEWLSSPELNTHQRLTEELLDHQDYLATKRIKDSETLLKHEQKKLCDIRTCVDPLSQLFKMLKRIATTGGV